MLNKLKKHEKNIISLISHVLNGVLLAQDSTVVHIWPDKVPGEKQEKQSSVITDDHSNDITRLTDVTDPKITVFRPESTSANEAAVLILPGGGYQILAIDLEGYEIAHWLNKQGLTAFVLEYRVPGKQKGALQDAQRAMRLIRADYKKWNINPKKVGILGFSAGGSLAVRLSLGYNKKLYPVVDETDTENAKPNFSLLIYPAYLAKGPDHSLPPDLAVDCTKFSQTFIFQTADDPFGNSGIGMAKALKNAKVPVEFHLYPRGGHGYGLRKGNEAGEIWPILAEKWLKRIINQK